MRARRLARQAIVTELDTIWAWILGMRLIGRSRRMGAGLDLLDVSSLGFRAIDAARALGPSGFDRGLAARCL